MNTKKIYFVEKSTAFNSDDLNSHLIAGSEKTLINITSELSKNDRLDIKVFNLTKQRKQINGLEWNNINEISSYQTPDFLIAMSDANLLSLINCKKKFLWSHSVQSFEKFLRKKQLFAFIKNKDSIFDFEFLKKLSLECDVPLTIGGGIKSLLDVDQILRSGADKISINTSALESPDFIKEIVKKYGSQQIVLSVDFKKVDNELYCFSNCGKKQTNIKLLDWIIKVQKLKVGEIILCSIDHDGTMKGYDIESLQKVIKYVEIPIIISGGAGSKEDILEAFKLDVSAVSISSLFHFTEITPKEIINSRKQFRTSVIVRNIYSEVLNIIQPIVIKKLKSNKNFENKKFLNDALLTSIASISAAMKNTG